MPFTVVNRMRSRVPLNATVPAFVNVDVEATTLPKTPFSHQMFVAEVCKDKVTLPTISLADSIAALCINLNSVVDDSVPTPLEIYEHIET